MSFKLGPKDLHKPTAAWYSDYLQSPIWAALRARLLVKRGPNCERCKAQPSFSLHHKTYARLFNELEVDVEFLCKECHYEAHKKDDIPFLYLIYYDSLQEVQDFLTLLHSEPKIRQPKQRKHNNT